MIRVGIAADHGGFALKVHVAESLRGSGYEVVDFGAYQLDPEDDYPDFVIPLARAIAARRDRTWSGALRQRCGGVDRREQGSRRASGAHP